MAMIKSTFTLPKEIVLELDTFAEELNQKKSHLIQNALQFYFDYLDLKIAEKRANSKGERVSLEEMRKELEL
jgi:predicted transcriptional regulator